MKEFEALTKEHRHIRADGDAIALKWVRSEVDPDKDICRIQDPRSKVRGLKIYSKVD